MSCDTTRLLRDLARANVTVRQTGGNHYQILLPDGTILTIAQTPRNGGQMKWIRAKLRKAGVVL